jgi:hypothetical protein
VSTVVRRPSPPDDAVIVRLDATDADMEDPHAVAPQIPHASTLRAGSAVRVAGVATKRRALGRWLGDGHAKVPRVARCTALLARGYVAIAAAGDDVWGLAPDA